MTLSRYGLLYAKLLYPKWPAMVGSKGYNPQHPGKKSYQPILTLLAETREYIGGELRKGERSDRQTDRGPSGRVRRTAETVERRYAWADSGFYCKDARRPVRLAKFPGSAILLPDSTESGRNSAI